MAYPTPYDTGDTLFQTLGTFWRSTFADQDVLKGVYAGAMQESASAYLRFLEAMAVSCRFTAPVFSRDNWYYVTVLESELAKKVTRYGDGTVFGDAVRYGVKTDAKDYRVVLPSSFRDCRYIFDRVVEPEVTLARNVDFYIDGNEVVFNSNPFDNASFSIETIVDSQGQAQDRRLELWLYAADFDLGLLYASWGVVIKTRMDSSEFYRDIINATLNAYIAAPSIAYVENLISAMCGIPLTLENGEVVEQVLSYPAKQQVVTDKHVYTLPLNCSVTVAVGDRLSAGDELCDALYVEDVLQRTPAASVFPMLVLGKNFHCHDDIGELIAENASLPLDYIGTDKDGFTEVRLSLGGSPQDRERFWKAVHAAGKLEGKTLAQYLDTRTNKTQDVPKSALPAAVNPLAFLLENVLGAAFVFIRVKSEAIAESAPGFAGLHLLRKIMPPGVAYVLHVDLPTQYTTLELTDEEKIEIVEIDTVTDTLTDFTEETIVIREIAECET